MGHPEMSAGVLREIERHRLCRSPHRGRRERQTILEGECNQEQIHVAEFDQFITKGRVVRGDRIQSG